MLVSLFADASFHNQFKAAGWGAWVRSERGRAYNGGAWGHWVSSSAIAEFLAICEGYLLGRRTEILMPGDTVLIQTDCSGIIPWFNHGSIDPPRYVKSKHFQLTPASRMLDEINYEIRTKNIHLQIKHVKGHQSNSEPRNYVNNLCDRLAKKGGQNAKVVMATTDPNMKARVHKKYLYTPDRISEAVPEGVNSTMERDESGKLTINFGGN